ncbi:glycosyl hydrolase family 28-related protein [Bacillus sp. T3]|uniref:glycosyl hydrolase family 28-related protein n=1 Tax=Bacillus sp. T3 TaxID=467262 RepID=UPI002980CF38|nr:glycosyl hydrolase family 28-related protein [Bacillus sp. T3]
MIDFEKQHNPEKNAELLAQLTENQVDLAAAVQETEQLFQLYYEEPKNRRQTKRGTTQISIKQKTNERIYRLFSKPATLLDRTKIIIDKNKNIYPEWKTLLDQEYSKLKNLITREVNVQDYGAIGDGKTDCTSAFNKAIGTGRVKVIVPEGVYVTKGIKLPSWTVLVGAGKGRTIIKLHNDAPKGTRLVTNANHWRGNHHLFVGSLSLDWNVERLGNAVKTSTGGNHSSCLTYANVKYGWVQQVEGINPGLHCFDISSTLYNYGGDGYLARGGSQYVWLDGLNGYGFGDDGITTHHSDHIFISHCHMCDPSGRAHQQGFSNSNGIEIDDGSRNVVLLHNSTARCFGGIEIKAHQNSSAASYVNIIGHISVHDNRSYNFRHIGHHKSTDEESKTAYNIQATNIVAIAPVFSELYGGSSPRGLVVSAYRNVVINHFSFIGDPKYNYRGAPICAIQYRARNVVLNHFHFRGISASSGPEIKIYRGPNQPEEVKIINVFKN